MLISFAIALTGLFILSISVSRQILLIYFWSFFCFCDSRINSGITPTLTFVGKIVIIILMYIGRIGPITMVLIFCKENITLRKEKMWTYKRTYLNRIMRWKTICCIRAWNFGSTLVKTLSQYVENIWVDKNSENVQRGLILRGQKQLLVMSQIFNFYQI